MPGDADRRPATIRPASWRLRRQQATSRDDRIASYKREATGSNPVAPTRFPQAEVNRCRGRKRTASVRYGLSPDPALAERAGRGLFLNREAGQGRARKQNANTASAPSTISQATRPPSQPSTAEPITRIASRTTARTGD